MHIETLVVDSAPIINSALKLSNLYSHIVTVPEVIAEIKDEESKRLLDTLTITQKTPSEEAMKQSIGV